MAGALTDTDPRGLEAEIALRDGSTVHVRPIRSDDTRAFRAFLDTVSPESIGFRFFGMVSLDWVTRWAVEPDRYADRLGLVVETGAPRRIVAHAAYVGLEPPLSAVDGDDRLRATPSPTDTAEVAFLVADAWQGKGISTILLAQLAAAARRHGIATFTAEVLATNHRMIDVFRQSGFAIRTRSDADVIHLELPTSLSAQARARFESRERLAATAAVKSFLEPRSVAVIGASRDRVSVGGQILHNLRTGGFTGDVFAVNEHGGTVQSVPAYRSLQELPEPPELAVVAVPAERVVSVAHACASAGVRALLVISAGFAEVGEPGAQRQRELLAVCREAGMRIIGPNCLGLINTAPAVGLNATFAPDPPVSGRVAFMSQSGGLGIAMIEAAAQAGVGLSSFVSVGNKADISGNDLLCYWEQDAGTDVALLYLESFGDPRRFARWAPRLARRKPVVAVKSGRSVAGARATSSHTGALLSASDVTVDALFGQAGVIRTDTLSEMLDVAALLAVQPAPRGGRVAIVTNAGGPGIMCADACQVHGVEVPELTEAVRSKLAGFLPAEASTHNPVDMIATASAEDYRRVLTALVQADACDAILVIFVPALLTDAGDVARAIRTVAETRPGVPIAGVFMTGERPPAELSSDAAEVPGYRFPEEAARAVALAARYGSWRARPQRAVSTPDGIRRDEAAAIVSRALGGGGGWLDPDAVSRLLECYGLPLIATRFVADPQAAVAAASDLGGPVAIKATASGLLHKTDAGGVVLGLQGPDAVRSGARQVQRAIRTAGYQPDGLMVQAMAPAGVELIVGVVNDHHFGPVIACGAGGTAAELLGDVSVRITPITDADAEEMLRSLRTFPLLDGYRGSPRGDTDAVADVLLRVSAMVEAHPEIVELDCNPLIVTAGGATVVDGRVRVKPAPPPRPTSALAR